MNNEICGECGEPVKSDELACDYDGETCHLDCAAKAQDEVDFDSWFRERG